MAILRLGNSGFLYWMSSRGISRVQIGRATLVPKADVMARCGGLGGKPGE